MNCNNEEKIEHNWLEGLQGGNINERYHVTETQWHAVTTANGTGVPTIHSQTVLPEEASFWISGSGKIDTAPVGDNDLVRLIDLTTVGVNYVLLSRIYNDPKWVNTLDWNKIINKPTTLLDYGITDAIQNQSTAAQIANFWIDGTGTFINEFGVTNTSSGGIDVFNGSGFIGITVSTSTGEGYININEVSGLFRSSFITPYSIYSQRSSHNIEIQWPTDALMQNYTITLPVATGTIALTSDLTAATVAYLPLTGGTLTGPLNGTYATFTGDIATTGGLLGSLGSTAGLNIGDRTNTANIWKLYSQGDTFQLIGSTLATVFSADWTTRVVTFTNSPIVPTATTSGQAVNLGQINGSYVNLTTNQSTSGVKSFSDLQIGSNGITFDNGIGNKSIIYGQQSIAGTVAYQLPASSGHLTTTVSPIITPGLAKLTGGANQLAPATPNTDYLPVNSPTTTGTLRATQYRISSLNTAPISATDIGTVGDIRWTSGYVYLCIATNTWVRSSLTTF